MVPKIGYVLLYELYIEQIQIIIKIKLLQQKIKLWGPSVDSFSGKVGDVIRLVNVGVAEFQKRKTLNVMKTTCVLNDDVQVSTQPRAHKIIAVNKDTVAHYNDLIAADYKNMFVDIDK